MPREVIDSGQIDYKRNRPTAILTADWHIRETQPECRTDDFIKTQWRKLQFIDDLQRQFNVPVLIGGDFFHYWKPSPWLISETMLYMPNDVTTVFGQHDLPNHSFKLAYKSGLYTLREAGFLILQDNGSWGQPIKEVELFDDKSIVLTHRFVWDGKEIPWPGCKEITAEQMLDSFPQADLIVTGDHHKPFTYEKDGRLLVNPGPITRQAANETSAPRVYLWYAETNTVEPVYIPIEKDVITREHIDKQQQSSAKLDAFVTSLDSKWEIGVSVLKNLERFLSNNKVHKSIVDVTYKAIEHEKG